MPPSAPQVFRLGDKKISYPSQKELIWDPSQATIIGLELRTTTTTRGTSTMMATRTTTTRTMRTLSVVSASILCFQFSI
jgi:hypothetical protein